MVKKMNVNTTAIFKDFDKSKLEAHIYRKGTSKCDIARPFLNLEIVPCYKTVIDEINGEEGMVRMNSGLMGFTNMSVKDLIDTAIANSFTNCNVNHIAERLSMLTGDPVDFFEAIPMYVITSNDGVCGAINIANTKALNDLANNLDSDLYILPSSIHEIIAVPVSTGDPIALCEMVREVNATEVAPCERLSNSVYRFSRKTKKVTLA